MVTHPTAIAPVGLTRYIHEIKVARTIGWARLALPVSRPNMYQAATPPRKISQVCDSITRDAVLHTWVPNATPTATIRLDPRSSIWVAVLNTTTANPAF